MGRRRTSDDRTPRRAGTASVVRATLAQQLIGSVDRATATRWEAAQERADRLEGTRDERVAAVTKSIRREVALAGAASGGTAAVPGVGLGTASAAFAVELAWTTVRLCDLIMTIAVIHGHGRAGLEERRMWILSILTYRDGAAGILAGFVAELAETSGRNGVRRISERTMQRINATVGRVVVGKYGKRAGVAAVGRAVPFGVGAALGYGINSRAVSTVSGHAHSFFSEFPIALEAIDVEPR
ncbi:hypothetical protein [Ilumatobacter nonamiensis]|uniref:hypothetical protein n=1 Tax=Ilumatobacter nonamiensis TaxID=467093 RepID=UPI000346F479|nr:hypothetical protein [Ilumatobacter nonamiensis]